MKNFLIVFACFIGSYCFSQHDKNFVDTKVSEFTSSLSSRNISFWLVTKRYCQGTVELYQMPDGSMCSSKGTYYAAYVLWREEDRPMIKKIDNCGLFYTIEQPSMDILDFVYERKSSLSNESVKTYAASQETTPTQSTDVHPCGRDFQFNFDGSISEQQYQLFDLTNDSKFPNLNYEYNMSLKVVELDSMLDTLISQKEPKFRRQSY